MCKTRSARVRIVMLPADSERLVAAASEFVSVFSGLVVAFGWPVAATDRSGERNGRADGPGAGFAPTISVLEPAKDESGARRSPHGAVASENVDASTSLVARTRRPGDATGVSEAAVNEVGGRTDRSGVVRTATREPDAGLHAGRVRVGAPHRHGLTRAFQSTRSPASRASQARGTSVRRCANRRRRSDESSWKQRDGLVSGNPARAWRRST